MLRHPFSIFEQLCFALWRRWHRRRHCRESDPARAWAHCEGGRQRECSFWRRLALFRRYDSAHHATRHGLELCRRRLWVECAGIKIWMTGFFKDNIGWLRKKSRVFLLVFPCLVIMHFSLEPFISTMPQVSMLAPGVSSASDLLVVGTHVDAR